MRSNPTSSPVVEDSSWDSIINDIKAKFPETLFVEEEQGVSLTENTSVISRS